jgi:hypothetical protein
MAKRDGSNTDTAAAESKIEEFAEDLGRLLGTAQNKAQSWLGQRQAIVKNLTELRDTATRLLSDLGHEAQKAVGRGRPRKGATQYAPAPKSKKQRRKMSAKARAAISAAQKLRWAKHRAEAKKK